MSGAYNQYKVICPWGQYYQLNPLARAEIVQGEIDESSLEYQDVVMQFPTSQEAKECKEAFENLCWAAWTPNQSLEEREKNEEIVAESEIVLGLARRKGGSW